ncbi:hypothetical protein RND71_038395 [Anisodus tanguticus]|uniref:Tetrahydrofolate dehydrogenase/cyclohydrolase catalytic domain-containing protein n=1 Tax=Anisodus tanguticus TaxID=243964 RepID=A0AAE1UZ45_9SOLA|nr:hypothetical protein RND71_038395 [Anisodus tanguticus]
MAFHEVGFRFSIAELPESCTEEEVCDALSNYNKDASIHGILVQLPLPQVNLQLSSRAYSFYVNIRKHETISF